MSDKSSDTEDWAIVDKDGELELSDEGSSASSIEVVNVVNDVVIYQNRRSLERSVSPTLQYSSTVDTENEGLVAESSLSSTSLENQENIVTKDPFASNSDEDIGEQEKVDCSKQELSTMTSLTGDQPQIKRELSVASDISSVPSILSIPSDRSDNSSDADSDYIRLESDSLDGDNLVMTSSSVSSNFNFIGRENSPLTEDGAGVKQAVLEKRSSEELEESRNSHSDESINQKSNEGIDAGPCENINQEHNKGVNKEPDIDSNQKFDDDNQNPAGYNNQFGDDIQNMEVGNHLLEAHNQNPADIDERLENRIQNLVVDNQVLDAYNQNPVEIDDRVNVDIQHQLVDNQVLEDDNQNLRDNNNLGNEDLSDVEQHDESAEVEEDQDRYTDSGTEDDRIESDQSDGGSIPPLDDDMSFVNDIGDLPLVAGDVARQYVHNPNRHLNLILDVIAILMFAVVVGLGIGHAIATFDEIEEYDTLHSNIVSLRSQALTCQNQKWSQKVTINDLRVEQESLNKKYKESKAEQDKLRIKNMLLLMELETFRKHEISTNEDKDIRLKLQNEINQLKTEKEELKQVIGRLKYTTHPANKNIGNTDNARINNELCDKSTSDTNDIFTYHGKSLSDCSLDDLQEIHNSESLENSLLKQEVGRLRYTSLPVNHVTTEIKSSEDEVYVDTEHQKITEDFKCENMTALKEELDYAQHNAKIWYQEYMDLKEQNQLNSTNCLKYIISNLNTSQFVSIVNTTVFKTWLASSAAAAKDVQNVVSEMGSKVWDDVSKTSQEILQTIADEYQMADDPDYDTDLDDDTYLGDDDTDLAYDDTYLGDDVTDFTDDDNTNQDVDNKGPINEANEEIDSDSSNDTEENTEHHAKWSDNVKDILNKTRHKMSNVSQQIKDTWLQVKNLSHQFWTQHEEKVTKTLTKFTHKVANFGKRIKDKLQQKVSRWNKKDKGRQRNEETVKHQKSNKSSEGKIKRDNGHKKNKQHDRKWNKKQLKHQAKQERKFHKRAQFQKKKQERSEKKLEKILNKYQNKMFNKMNNNVFQKLDEKSRQSEVNKIYHIQRFAAELGLYSDKHKDNSKIRDYLEFLNCQDLWWSNVVVKDMPTDSQILHCSQFLPDWQLKQLLNRRRSMLIEGKRHISDEKTEKEIVKIQKTFGIYDGDEKVQLVKEGTHSDDTIESTTVEYSDWQFKRAYGREELRQRESEPDWLFERANQRKESREEESETDWVFERAKHRKDLRYKEWEEPAWTFMRAKHREEVREEEHQPDLVCDILG